MEPGTAVYTAASEALATKLVSIESSETGGYAALCLIGNTTEVCRDGRERARAALEACGVNLPAKRVVISLTPAEVKKDGSHMDLPMAVSLLLLVDDRPPAVNIGQWLFAGELGLDGQLRPVRGIISFALAAVSAGMKGIVIAPENIAELEALKQVEAMEGLEVLAFSRLPQVMSWLYGGVAGSAKIEVPALKPQQTVLANYDDMQLSPQLQLAAATAAAGMHSLLLSGPPGTGKSMLAQRLPSILPVMERQRHIEAMRIHSSQSERLSADLLVGRPPFRAPHHQASANAVLGNAERPGELSLAHGGVLFLDELPEYRRDLLESLREPLETDEIRIARTMARVVWKGRVLLVAAANNCPCGWYGSRIKRCRCHSQKILQYQNRMSGPILDRIDLHINMPERSGSGGSLLVELAQKADKTRLLREQVERAREMQRRRWGEDRYNRDLQPADLVEAAALPAAQFAALVDRELPPGVGNRTLLRCLRVARTLADLSASPEIAAGHIRQALAWQRDQAVLERGQELSSQTVTV